MSEFFLGIDLGGTSIKAGVTDHHGKLLAKLSVPTGAGPDHVIANMVQVAKATVEKSGHKLADMAAVGVASPGPLSVTRGVVIRSANLPGWENVKLRERISAALQLPAVLENDANAAAYGEYWAGVGKSQDIQDLVMFTLGTGVGGGIVDEGRVLHGAHDFAAELGHIIVVPDGAPCNCGQRGCLEMYAAASRTGERAAHLVKTGVRQSSLNEVYAKTGTVTAADVSAHAKNGDALSLNVWDTTCRYLAIACVTAVQFLDPEMIVLAGGMADAGDFLVEPVRRHFAAQYWNMTPPMVKIAIAALASDAGAIGAAGCAAYALRHGQLSRPAPSPPLSEGRP